MVGTPPTAAPLQSGLDRRTLILGGGLAAAGLLTFSTVRRLFGQQADVFVAANQSYSADLTRTIREGLLATGLDPTRLREKRVLLKPNMVEPTRDAPHMTTHPAVVRAAAAVFQGWGAEVCVGEGPGHVRDTEMALVESGIQDALDADHLPFADLNYEAVGWVKNRGRVSPLPGLFLPQSVRQADMVVSIPKMKTHHWQGVTASMKNLYGVIPGIKYGWPKNVLHYAGIPQTVFDINASLPKTIAIVDGIEAMEGDGPIMGSRKSMGLIVVGCNPTAVDATVCRLMQLNPYKVNYLALAEGRLGPLAEHAIHQRGEPWQPHAKPFEILDKPHLRVLREGVLAT